MPLKVKTGLLVMLMMASFSTLFGQLDTASLSALLHSHQSELGKQFAFTLYKDGKIIYKKESGEFNIKTQQDINTTSQWLTAALTMVLVQDGKVGLDDKITKYLPIFAKYGKGYITIRHCLTHNTGIDGGKMFEKGRFKTLEDEVNHFASNREIKTNPGTEFYYSNIGFKIVARVLEVAAKKPFDRLMKEKLTSPLMMRNTTFSSDNYNDAPDPATGAKSTAFDLTNFLAMLLNKGSFNNKQVLTEESVKTFLSLQYSNDQIKNAPKETAGLDYAIGSWILERNAQNEPSAFIVPSQKGTYPLVDICRGYVFVVFTKQQDDVKKEVYSQIKALLDEAFGNGCKQ